MNSVEQEILKPVAWGRDVRFVRSVHVREFDSFLICDLMDYRQVFATAEVKAVGIVGMIRRLAVELYQLRRPMHGIERQQNNTGSGGPECVHEESQIGTVFVEADTREI
jgi:hypothetical protein